MLVVIGKKKTKARCVANEPAWSWMDKSLLLISNCSILQII